MLSFLFHDHAFPKVKDGNKTNGPPIGQLLGVRSPVEESHFSF